MKIDLEGMNILVTGASRGIGKAITENLAEAGARVAVHYHRQEEKARELAAKIGGDHPLFAADLAVPGECTGLLERVGKKMGPIHALVNNAGIAIESPIDKPGDAWLADWQQTMQVNLTALALLCRGAIEQFIPQGGGRIVNISSRAAFRGDTVDYLAYAASKGGVVSLTRSIARGFGKQNIKAFLVAPGFVRTDMAQDFFDKYGDQIALDDIALPKLTEPGDLAPLVTLLCSGLADHATGGTFDINAASYVH